MSDHDLTAAYAVDALDGDESRAAEEHLRGCAPCRADLAGIREALADAVAPAVPPPALRDRVMAALDDVEQLPPLPAAHAAATADAPAPEPLPGPRDELAARRSRRQATVPGPRRWVQVVAAAAAAVVVAGAAVAGYSALQWRSEATAARQAAVALAEVASAPDAVTVAAQGGDAAWAGTRVIASAALGEAVLVPSGVAAAPSGKAWQVWFVTGDTPRSAGLLATDGGADGAPAVLEGAVDGATAVAVTLEPAGGSQAPTTTPVAVYPLGA